MELYEVAFLLFFLGGMGLLALKLFNVVRCSTSGPVYEFPGSITSFIGYILMWGFTFVVMLQEPSELLYVVLWQFMTWCMLLNVMLFFIELFLLIKGAASQPIQAYRSIEQTGKAYTPASR